jgi:methionyl-tRNA formyltransferase
MGTPDFAVTPLRALIESSHKVIAVYTQPPRPKGRGYEIQSSPVQKLAESYNIPVHHPLNFKDGKARETFISLVADVAVVAAYGLILPQAILDAPRYGCLNIHASLLPRWRGASPIQHAIWNGDTESGVTIMQMESGLDTGPMINKGSVPITSTTTAEELHDALASISGKLITDVLATLAHDGKLAAEPQDDRLSSYAPLLNKENGKLDLSKPPEILDRQIRALNPWPGTFIDGLKGRVKILKAHLDKGALIFDLVQPDGKKPMDFTAAVNGGYLSQ